MLALRVEGLSKSYRNVEALRDVSLSVEEGQIYGIIGPDGAGKSTLMKIVAGVLSFDRGRVEVFGVDVGRFPERVKSILSFMPQGIGQNLYMDLTVSENIDFFASIKGSRPSDVRDLKERLLEVTGLSPFRDRFAKHLSGGMQQKLGICCSLISRPRFVILDEPTTGVDPVSRRELWDLLYEFVEDGITILFSTSYMDEAERSHRFCLMHEGRILGEFDPEDEELSADELFRRLVPAEGFSFSIPFERREATSGVEVDSLTKRFGNFVAVDGVSFEVEPGEIFGLLGPNGAGKTTTIKMMVGLLKPTSGTVRIAGREKIGYMSQKFSLYKDLTVSENIDYYGAVYGIQGRELRRRRDWILEISGLEGMEGMKVADIPLGFKQRLALGCSFIHLPEVLFLDEPTSGVDPSARDAFWEIIRGLSDHLGVTVIITTHHLLEAHYCNRLALMSGGKVVALGSPHELIKRAEGLQGRMYELSCSDPYGAREFLRGSGVVCYFYGKKLRVWTKLSEGDVRKLLERAGFENFSLVPSPVNMEDVFILFSGMRGEVSSGSC